MNTISKSFKIEAAHILDLPYESKCKNLHGHSYTVTVEMQGELNDVGMVFDYSAFPKDFIMQMDHKLLVADRHVATLPGELSTMVRVVVGYSSMVLRHESVFIMKGLTNTTAEEIARWLYQELRTLNSLVTAVTVKETESTQATYRGE